MSRAIKSDVEGGFLKPIQETVETIKKANQDDDTALKSINTMLSAFAVKKAADSIKEVIEQDLKKSKEKEEEKTEKKGKKSGDMLQILFMMKNKGMIDDNTFKNMLLMTMMSDSDGFNPMLLMMAGNSNSSDSDLKKEIRMLRKQLKKLKEEVRQPAEKQEAQEDKETSVLKTLIEAQNRLLETLLTSKKDPLDDLQKYADIISKLSPQQREDELEKFVKMTELFTKLGLVSDKTKEKLLEFRKEIMAKKLETEKELEKMRLEREKLRAEAEVQMATKQAETIKNIGDMVIKSAIKGFLEASRPEAQTQKETQKAQEPAPQSPPKSVNMVTLQHTDEQGNLLHQFNIPVEVLEKNRYTENGKTYYKVICPYDNQELVYVEEENNGEKG